MLSSDSTEIWLGSACLLISCLLIFELLTMRSHCNVIRLKSQRYFFILSVEHNRLLCNVGIVETTRCALFRWRLNISGTHHFFIKIILLIDWPKKNLLKSYFFCYHFKRKFYFLSIFKLSGCSIFWWCHLHLCMYNLLNLCYTTFILRTCIVTAFVIKLKGEGVAL